MLLLHLPFKNKDGIGAEVREQEIVSDTLPSPLLFSPPHFLFLSATGSLQRSRCGSRLNPKSWVLHAPRLTSQLYIIDGQAVVQLQENLFRTGGKGKDKLLGPVNEADLY